MYKLVRKSFVDESLQKKMAFYFLTKENLDSSNPENLGASDFAVGMNVIDDYAYFSFHNGWVTLQLSISWNQVLRYRFKWGNNVWTDWKDV